MIYLYHFVPESMQGTILYPLNELKLKLPELFEKYLAKYESREEVKETVIPGLGNWNDVIHLSPIDPKKVRAGLQEGSAPADFSWKAFQIEASTLDQSQLIIMVTYKKGNKYHKEFLPFTEQNYLQNNELPDITKQHYRDVRAKGERPFIYGGAPHVFYKGTIDTKGLEVISV